MKVAVVMGSEKDLPKMQGAVEVLDRFEVDHEVLVLSAHKDPDTTLAFAESAREEGFSVLIAGAGKAAHLAGLLAAKTTLPVIGVPVGAGPLAGWDSLLSTVQMPTGVPVATVGVDASANAALLAVAILALHDERLAKMLDEYRRELSTRSGVRNDPPAVRNSRKNGGEGVIG
ncbi:MAG: 5-(carboxyamino)imidazole ribonucleotide mutase [Acidimicrobiia bacterium]